MIARTIPLPSSRTRGAYSVRPVSWTGGAVAVALGAGVAGSVQVAVMGRFGERIGTLEALAFTTVLGALIATALLFVVRRSLDGYSEALDAPKWLWLGAAIGVFVVALLAAIGGGLLRDALFLNRTPVFLANPAYLSLIAGATIVTAVFARYLRNLIGPDTVQKIVDYIDALGTPAFAVFGMQLARDAGLPLIAILFVGVSNGVRPLRMLVAIVITTIPTVMIVIHARLSPIQLLNLRIGSENASPRTRMSVIRTTVPTTLTTRNGIHAIPVAPASRQIQLFGSTAIIT